MENFGWVLYIFDGCFISCSVMSNSLHPHGLQPARLLSPWDSPGRNTGVSGHSLLQGVFLTPLMGVIYI